MASKPLLLSYALASVILFIHAAGQDGPDSDNDGIPDGLEIEFGTDPNDPDSDDDGLSDGDEIQVYGTDPTNPDTDDGGVNDGDEVDRGTDPWDSEDDAGLYDAVGGSLFGCTKRSARNSTEWNPGSDPAVLAAALGVATFWERRKRR